MNDTSTNTVSVELFEQHKKRLSSPQFLSSKDINSLKGSIKKLLVQNNATLIAHYLSLIHI